MCYDITQRVMNTRPHKFPIIRNVLVQEHILLITKYMLLKGTVWAIGMRAWIGVCMVISRFLIHIFNFDLEF
jgi:hypothetical protein